MTERRTPDATLIEAVRILSRTINTDDGVIPACLAEAAKRLAELVEERLTNDEREAIQLALTLEWPHTSEQWEALAGCVGPVCKVPAHKHKVAIRRFLERQPVPPGPEGDGNG